VDFQNLEIVLKGAGVSATGETVALVAIRCGRFLNTVIDFLIVAFTILMVIRSINRLASLRARPMAEPAFCAQSLRSAIKPTGRPVLP
jgi:large conductance mechanosensitive channel